MIVLDTNVISALMRTPVDPPVKAWLATLSGELMIVSTVSIVEISYGLARLPVGKRRQRLAQLFEEMLTPEKGLAIRALEEVSARRAGAFMALREARGRPVSDADMMIAGIAAANSAALATRNVRDYDGLGLSLLDPWNEAA